jgi:hypothetical protein
MSWRWNNCKVFNLVEVNWYAICDRTPMRGHIWLQTLCFVETFLKLIHKLFSSAWLNLQLVIMRIYRTEMYPNNINKMRNRVSNLWYSVSPCIYRVRQDNFLFWIWNAKWKRKLPCRTLYNFSLTMCALITMLCNPRYRIRVLTFKLRECIQQ